SNEPGLLVQRVTASPFGSDCHQNLPRTVRVRRGPNHLPLRHGGRQRVLAIAREPDLMEEVLVAVAMDRQLCSLAADTYLRTLRKQDRSASQRAQLDRVTR